MELVEGRTIRDLLINAEAPGPEQALIIVSGVLEALAYSHQHGIVHRDIKPANVIITNTGAVKVMDFGIARALHGAQSTMTQTGMVNGTPQYLSPEQALGKAVDHRSDLYATGCLLYELLALRPPFTGESAAVGGLPVDVQDIPVPPSEVAQGAPPELDGPRHALPREGAGRPVPDRRGDARPCPVRAADAVRPGRAHRHLEHRPGRHARGVPHPGIRLRGYDPRCRTPVSPAPRRSRRRSSRRTATAAARRLRGARQPQQAAAEASCGSSRSSR